ncbi:MAG: RHS repeat protein [Chthonomonadetes bacterium]|nr:RHS repeat protein [Chthonomonadetes bacterium]
MTLFDFGLLVDAFGSMPGDPNWNPDADLDGDDEVTLFDYGILTSNFGLLGAEEFAGSAQSASGNFNATLRVVLGDWTAQTERAVYVLLQFKRAGTESDPNTPIYEQVVQFGQGEVEKDVSVSLPAGIYTVRSLAYNDQSRTDVSHWLRSELTGFVVPQGGGSPRQVSIAPGWAEDVIPADSVPSGGLGPSSASHVNLASGAYEHVPGPDLEVSNPYGPPVIFARRYSSQLAQQGKSSPGLGIGWTHSLDMRIVWTVGSTSALLGYPNGATESLGVVQQGGVFRFVAPQGAPYAGLAEPDSAYPGGWKITLFYRDRSRLVFAPVSQQTTSEFRLVGMVNPAGNAVGLWYENGLLRFVRAGTTTLFELVYDSNSLLVQAKAYDAEGGNYATVYYTQQQLDDGNLHLTQVSQVNAPASLRWGFTYGYVLTRGDGSRMRLLTQVTAPDPRNSARLLSVPVGYDANGMVQMLMDANGHARRYVYNANGTTDVVVYNGATGQQEFGWRQKLGVAGVNAGLVDAENNESQMVYANTYLPTLYTDRNGQVTEVQYDAFGNPVLFKSPRNIRTEIVYTYPADYPLSPVQQIEVKPVGSDGTRKTSTIYTFYTLQEEQNLVPGARAGLLKSVQSPLPGTTGSGERVTTRYYYVGMASQQPGNLAIVEAPGANDAGRARTTVYFYERDPFTGESFVPLQGRPVAVAVYDETIANVWQEYQYWLQNRNDAFWTSAPRRLIFFQRYRYDLLGRLIAVIDAAGNATTFTYNAAHQVEKVTYPPAMDAQVNQQGNIVPYWVVAEERYVYYPGPGGQLGQVQLFANGAFVRSAVLNAGAEGELTGTSVGGSQPIGVQYDAQYRARSVQDGRGNNTGIEYTATGFPALKEYPLGDTFNWYYAPVNQQTAWWGQDKEGNPVARIDANGILTRYVYSPIDSRLERVEYYTNPTDPASLVSSETIQVTYDAFNRVSSLWKADAQIEYTYDDNDLVLSVSTTYPAPVGTKTITYTYYPDGSRKTMNVPNVGTFNYSYYYTTSPVLGLTIRVGCPWTPRPNITSYYDQAGRLRQETSGGVITDYDYYPRGWLSRQVSRDGFNNPLCDFANGGEPGIFYDAAGNRTWMRVYIPPQGQALGIAGWVKYEYDARDRLTREAFILDNGQTWYNDAYAYDGADNLTSVHGNTFSHNANNQIAGSGFQYDPNGNATLFRALAVGYDLENRTIRLPDLYRGGSNVIQSYYRPDGLQAWRQDAGGRVYSLYDGTRLVAEYSGSNGSLLQHFGYSAEGLSQRRGNQHRLFTFDPDGNLVHRVIAGDLARLSITWHNRLGVVYQDQLASNGQLVDAPNAGTVGYQGYFGVYSDPSTRTYGQGRLAALVTLNAGGYFDPVTAQGMQRNPTSVNPYARLYRSENSLADRVANLVFSWADAGWTSGDPSAPEGAALVKAASALARTINMGLEIETIASLPRAMAGGIMLAGEAAEALAEGGLRLAGQTAKELKPVVIGENMDRVRQYASGRYLTIDDFVPQSAWEAARAQGLEAMLALNQRWITQMMRQGRRIIDIGPEFPARRAGRPYRPSIFYELERRLLKGYPLHERVFERRGSFGGVPGLDPESEFWWR